MVLIHLLLSNNVIYPIWMCFISLIRDVLAAAGVAANEKDLEIALLRQQLRVLQRQRHHTRLSRPKKLMLVALADKLKGKGQRFRDRLSECVLFAKPDTLLSCQRDLA